MIQIVLKNPKVKDVIKTQAREQGKSRKDIKDEAYKLLQEISSTMENNPPRGSYKLVTTTLMSCENHIFITYFCMFRVWLGFAKDLEKAV